MIAGKQLLMNQFWKTPDPEVVFLPQHKPAEVSIADLPNAHPSRSTKLAHSMAADCDVGAQGGDDVALSSGQRSEAGSTATEVAGISRASAGGTREAGTDQRVPRRRPNAFTRSFNATATSTAGSPSVRDPVPLVRRSGRMGSVSTSLFTKLCLVAAAFTGINHTLSDYQQGSNFHGFSNGQGQGEDEIFTGQFGEYLNSWFQPR